MDKEMFLNALKERILILDGGMGTMVQGFKLTERRNSCVHSEKERKRGHAV